MRTLSRLVAAACLVHYRLPSARGWLHLLGSIIDPFIYAGAAYVMIQGVFGRGGFDRYLLMALGFAVLRWTISALWASGRMTALYERLRPFGRGAGLAAIAVAMAPSSLAFLLTGAGIYVAGFYLAGTGPGWVFWPSLALVLLVQALGNGVAMLLSAWLALRGWVRSPVPLAALFFSLGMLSPILYGFGDLPFLPSAWMTSLNPISHILAAHHALHYGQMLSFEILPFSLPLLAAALFALNRLCKKAVPLPALEAAPEQTSGIEIWLRLDPAFTPPSNIILGDAVFLTRAWQKPIGLMGRDLAWLVLLFQDHDWTAARAGLMRIATRSAVRDLFDQDMTLYPAWAMAQFNFALAIEADAPRLIFDGLLDGASSSFAPVVLDAFARASRRGQAIIWVAYSWPALAERATGRYRVLKGPVEIESGHLPFDLRQASPARLLAQAS